MSESEYFKFNPKDRAELELLIPRLLIMAGEQTERAGDTSIFGKFDLSVSRFSLLASLARASRPLSMTEVKDAMVRSPSNLTQLVDSLEERGLVRRAPRPGDRRVHILELTKEGYQLLGQVRVQYEQVMREFLKSKTREELVALITLLIEIIQGMMSLQESELGN